MTPNEQLTIMKMIGEEQARFAGDPTDRDLEVTSKTEKIKERIALSFSTIFDFLRRIQCKSRWVADGCQYSLFQRYYYYIDKGIKSDMLAPQPSDVMKHVHSLIPHSLLSHLSKMTHDLEQEVKSDYQFSVRKCIGELLVQMSRPIPRQLPPSSEN